MKTLHGITTILSISSFLIPLIIGYKKRKSLLWCYLLFGFFCDLGMMICKRVLDFPTAPIAHFYTVVEFVFLSAYYYRFIKSRHILFVAYAVLLEVFYIAMLAIKGIDYNNGILESAFALTFIGYSLWGFYRLIKDREVENIVQSSFFIVNVAVLLGFSGKFLIFFFLDYLYVHAYNVLSALWICYKFLNVAVNILFAIALSNKHDE